MSGFFPSLVSLSRRPSPPVSFLVADHLDSYNLSRSSSISISNLSDLPAKIELRFISKVLSASRIFITIPPRESTTEKIDFFPRRINPHYTKQLNVRSLLDRSKDQMVSLTRLL